MERKGITSEYKELGTMFLYLVSVIGVSGIRMNEQNKNHTTSLTISLQPILMRGLGLLQQLEERVLFSTKTESN